MGAEKQARNACNICFNDTFFCCLCEMVEHEHWAAIKAKSDIIWLDQPRRPTFFLYNINNFDAILQLMTFLVRDFFFGAVLFRFSNVESGIFNLFRSVIISANYKYDEHFYLFSNISVFVSIPKRKFGSLLFRCSAAWIPYAYPKVFELNVMLKL